MRRARSASAFAAAFVVALVVAQSAFAHLPGGAFCSAKQPAKVERVCGKRAFYHGLGVVRWIRAHESRTTQAGDAQVAAQFRAVLHDHLWLMKQGQRWMAEASHRLTPTLADFGVPSSFVANAVCVHSHEGAWPDATGNGYGGGLQFAASTWNRAAKISHGVVPHVGWEGEIGKVSPMIQIYAAYLIVVKQDGGSWREWRNTANACGLWTGG